MPDLNDLTEWGQGYNSGGVTYLTSTWIVPNAPNNLKNNPVTFLWDGIEPDGLGWVVQPILGWGCCIQTSQGQQGGNFWYISAYYVNGATKTGSPIIQVSTADHIVGYVAYSSFSQCGGGTGYHISVNDNSIGQGGEHYACTGAAGTTARVVMENYRVSKCDQLSPSGGEQFYSLYSTPSLTWNFVSTANSPQCGYAGGPTPINIHIHSYPTTDIYTRSHGRSYDAALPVPWWSPYQSGYEIQSTNIAFDYYETETFQFLGSHYIQEAASGFVPSYAWHTQIYVNSALVTEGDVGRNQILQANFNANSYTIYWHN